MTSPPSRLLVVEDNRDLALGLRVNLEAEGHEVTVAHDGDDAIARFASAQPALVILDLMLPGRDGFDVLRRIREVDADVSVLILSARHHRLDKLRGFRDGADDYLTKPFDLDELLARVQVLLRRRARAAPAAKPHFTVDGIEVDVAARTVGRDGAPVTLTPKAFDLLVALCQREGEVVSRAELMKGVWGYQADVATRTLDTHIFELRQQLEADPAHPRLIRTVWRVGYRLQGRGAESEGRRG